MSLAIEQDIVYFSNILFIGHSPCFKLLRHDNFFSFFKKVPLWGSRKKKLFS